MLPYGTIMGRTTHPGSSHERVLPVATRPHTEYRVTPPLTLSGKIWMSMMIRPGQPEC